MLRIEERQFGVLQRSTRDRRPDDLGDRLFLEIAFEVVSEVIFFLKIFFQVIFEVFFSSRIGEQVPRNSRRKVEECSAMFSDLGDGPRPAR